MYHDLIGFTAGDEDGLYQSSNSPLQIIESFLEALTNADKDGRIVVNKQGKIFFFAQYQTPSCSRFLLQFSLI